MNYEQKVNSIFDSLENMWIFIREAVERFKVDEDMLLTKEEAAMVLNCSSRTIARLQERREIEFVVIRGAVRFTKQSLRDIIKRNTIRISPQTKSDFENNFRTIISTRTK